MIQNFTDEDKERNKQFGLLINVLANADDGSYYVFDKNSYFSNKLLKNRDNFNGTNKIIKKDYEIDLVFLSKNEFSRSL